MSCKEHDPIFVGTKTPLNFFGISHQSESSVGVLSRGPQTGSSDGVLSRGPQLESEVQGQSIRSKTQVKV